jgi:hypothetical protein
MAVAKSVAVRRLKSQQQKTKPAYAGFRSRANSLRRQASLCVGADLSAFVLGFAG